MTLDEAYKTYAGRDVLVTGNSNHHNYEVGSVVKISDNHLHWDEVYDRELPGGKYIMVRRNSRQKTYLDDEEGNWLRLSDTRLIEMPSFDGNV